MGCTIEHVSDDVQDLDRMAARLAQVDVTTLPDTERIELLAACERLKGAAAACQARTTIAFAASQRAAGRDQGVAAQVGLATRTSPARARRFVGLAHALRELPRTRAALEAGETSEYRAYLIAKETAFISLEDRRAVDAELAAQPGGIGALVDRSAESRARAISQRLDPASAVRRHSDAVRQRRVSLRAAPDGMSRLSAVLPLTDGVAAYASLQQAAATSRATGDGRGRGELMADELVARARAAAAATDGGRSVEVSLVMTDAALLGSDDAVDHQEPAQIVSDSGSHGTIPADVARGLVRDAATVWVRRLYRDPVRGDLVAMDSRRRVFGGALRRFLVLRDQACRTPWCDAPVRHLDHVEPHADGGATSAANAQGLCEACNQAKEGVGLRQHVTLSGAITTITPTGHSYTSHRPRPPGPPPAPRLDWSALEPWTLDRAPAWPGPGPARRVRSASVSTRRRVEEAG